MICIQFNIDIRVSYWYTHRTIKYITRNRVNVSNNNTLREERIEISGTFLYYRYTAYFLDIFLDENENVIEMKL